MCTLTAYKWQRLVVTRGTCNCYQTANCLESRQYTYIKQDECVQNLELDECVLKFYLPESVVAHMDTYVTIAGNGLQKC